ACPNGDDLAAAAAQLRRDRSTQSGLILEDQSRTIDRAGLHTAGTGPDRFVVPFGTVIAPVQRIGIGGRQRGIAGLYPVAFAVEAVSRQRQARAPLLLPIGIPVDIDA